MPPRLEQIPERLLARLWKERSAREEGFRAGNGRKFRVLYPGRSSTSAGPDFRGAVLEEEGVGLVTGDVELHLDQKDWHAHGHGTDPRYNGVVLHGVLGPEAGNTLLQNGNTVPVVSLGPMVERPPGSVQAYYLWELLSVHGYDRPGDLAEMATLLDHAGDQWFEIVSDTFGIFLNAGEDPEQLLYSAIMEALGYSQNRQPFLDLAYQVPYRRLQAMVRSRPSEERIPCIAETLLKFAGFSGGDHGNPPIALDSSPKSRLGWHTFRVRPQNHPQSRILGVSHLLGRYLSSSLRPSSLGPSDSMPLEPWAGKGLVQGLAHLIENVPEDEPVNGCRLLTAALTVNAGPKTGTSQGAIGKGRAGDIAVNAVLPFFHSLANHTGDTSFAERCSRMFRRFPKLQPNDVTREMEEQLCGSMASSWTETAAPSIKGRPRSVVNVARRQQGLLHLHHLIISPSNKV